MRTVYYDEHTGRYLKKKDLKEPQDNYIVYDDSAPKDCIIVHWAVRHGGTLKRLDLAYSKHDRENAYRMLLIKAKENNCILDHRVGVSLDKEMFDDKILGKAK